jgi:prepilin-type N-terminal cleavage/methylation domain-containing protein
MPLRSSVRRAPRHADAYTLLELLVVLAILAILFALTTAAAMRAWTTVQQRVDKQNWASMRGLGKPVLRRTPFRVLFIGNSYTLANDLPNLIATLARAAGDAPAFTYDSQLVGGATLQQHWNDGIALGKIRQGNWDFVVLQEQSQTPLFNEDAFDQYATLFDAEIKKQGAITLFFMTWARQSLPQTQAGLTRAYTNIAQKLHGEVAPVGSAWRNSLTSKPTLVLHDSDGSHPNPAGSYLAACVFYGHIYGKSPSGLPPQLTVSPTDAAWLQGIAWQTVQANNRLFQPDWNPR